MARLYISQKRMDVWSAENKIEVSGDTMTLVELGRSFTIRPAVRFLASIGSDDPHNLVGLVKDERELADMGADHMATSVIYQDDAYEVENGFIGTAIPKKKQPSAPTRRAMTR